MTSLHDFKAPASPARAAPLCGFASRGAAPTRSAYLTDECQDDDADQDQFEVATGHALPIAFLRPSAFHQRRLRRRSAMEHAPP